MKGIEDVSKEIPKNQKLNFFLWKLTDTKNFYRFQNCE